MRDEIVVNLSRAHDHAADLFRIGHGRVVENVVKPAADEIFPMTDRLGVAEQAFGGHDDERLAEVAFHLTPDEMKMLRGSGGVNHLHVVVGAEGEESLQSGAGMLGSGPLVAVGEEAG